MAGTPKSRRRERQDLADNTSSFSRKRESNLPFPQEKHRRVLRASPLDSRFRGNDEELVASPDFFTRSKAGIWRRPSAISARFYYGNAATDSRFAGMASVCKTVRFLHTLFRGNDEEESQVYREKHPGFDCIDRSDAHCSPMSVDFYTNFRGTNMPERRQSGPNRSARPILSTLRNVAGNPGFMQRSQNVTMALRSAARRRSFVPVIDTQCIHQGRATSDPANELRVAVKFYLLCPKSLSLVLIYSTRGKNRTKIGPRCHTLRYETLGFLCTCSQLLDRFADVHLSFLQLDRHNP